MSPILERRPRSEISTVRGADPGRAAPSPEAGSEDAPRGVLPFPLKRIGDARQVMIVTARSWTSTQARLEAYELDASGWTCRIGPVPARVGRTGMIPADRRLQGSGTTPAGTFALTMAFGLEPLEDTLMPYAQITSDDHWWVADPSSQHYNALRHGEQGGFRCTESGRAASERLVSHRPEYDHVLVIDFNRPRPLRSRGSGIFVRIGNGLATDGGVSVDRLVLLEVLRWLNPALRPVITIAPERSISSF